MQIIGMENGCAEMGGLRLQMDMWVQYTEPAMNKI